MTGTETTRTRGYTSDADGRRWWITTDWIASGGRKVLGPFESRDLALEARFYVERAQGRDDLFVDDEPAGDPS